MFKIISKQRLAKDITRIVVEAALICQRAQAGQFVILVGDAKAERIPLTLADWDRQAGTITLIIQEAGFSTRVLATRKPGDEIAHILGPLGHATQADKLGRIVCVGGGVGIAEVLPIAKAFKQAGNEVAGIIGARSKELLILEQEMNAVCRELYITTDDGSYGRKGFVTDILKQILNKQAEAQAEAGVNLVYAVGPIVMMCAVAELTRPYGLRTIVSLNPIMVDATGMCGACRCSVGGETKFACVDGPDFDAHQVDFAELEKRLGQFKRQEQIANGK